MASYITIGLTNGQTLNFEIENSAGETFRYDGSRINDGERASAALTVEKAVARNAGGVRLGGGYQVTFRDADVTSLSFSAPNLIVGGVSVEVDANSTLLIRGVARGPLVNAAAGSPTKGAAVRRVAWSTVSTISLTAVTDGGLAGQQNPNP